MVEYPRDTKQESQQKQGKVSMRVGLLGARLNRGIELVLLRLHEHIPLLALRWLLAIDDIHVANKNKSRPNTLVLLGEPQEHVG